MLIRSCIHLTNIYWVSTRHSVLFYSSIWVFRDIPVDKADKKTLCVCPVISELTQQSHWTTSNFQKLHFTRHYYPQCSNRVYSGNDLLGTLILKGCHGEMVQSSFSFKDNPDYLVGSSNKHYMGILSSYKHFSKLASLQNPTNHKHVI